MKYTFGAIGAVGLLTGAALLLAREEPKNNDFSQDKKDINVPGIESIIESHHIEPDSHIFQDLASTQSRYRVFHNPTPIAEESTIGDRTLILLEQNITHAESYKTFVEDFQTYMIERLQLEAQPLTIGTPNDQADVTVCSYFEQNNQPKADGLLLNSFNLVENEEGNLSFEYGSNPQIILPMMKNTSEKQTTQIVSELLAYHLLPTMEDHFNQMKDQNGGSIPAAQRGAVLRELLGAIELVTETDAIQLGVEFAEHSYNNLLAAQITLPYFSSEHNGEHALTRARDIHREGNLVSKQYQQNPQATYNKLTE